MSGTESTEWEDIQRKFGNLPPKELLVDESDVVNIAEETAAEFSGERKYANVDWDEFLLLEENANEEEEKILASIRQKRVKEMQQVAKKTVYGKVIDLYRRQDFEDEVTHASAVCVCVHLYQDGLVDCEIMDAALKILSNKFNHVKFVRILSTICIPNYPNEHLPTLLIYQEGKVIRQFVGLNPFGGKKMTPDDLEWELSKIGVVETSLEESPHITQQNRIFLNIKRK